ncbi:hypothetical protein H8356DRAFT_1616689, partial [Neocallimastix lanati (nom. inval.)]
MLPSQDFPSILRVCKRWYQLGSLCRWRYLNLNLSKPWDSFYFFLTAQQFPLSLHHYLTMPIKEEEDEDEKYEDEKYEDENEDEDDEEDEEKDGKEKKQNN